MNRWILSLASVIVLALAMSGCGGSEGSSSVGTVSPGDTNQKGDDTPADGSEASTEPAKDFTRTPNQFGDALPEVPAIPEMEG